MATLTIRTNAIETQNIKSVLPPYHRTGDSAGDEHKSGVTLGLDHLYSLSLFDFVCFIFSSLYWAYFDPPPGFGASFLVNSNRLWRLYGVDRYG